MIVDVEQGTPEWHELRSRRMTASHAQAIGANGKGLETYIMDMMCKYFSHAEDEGYSNSAMEHGVENEPVAVALYEFETGLKTEKVGFDIYNDYVGSSPDRFVGDEGMMEVKCPSDKVYFKYLLSGKIESKYMWQMQMQMLVSGRKWNDYTVYNPNFDKQIIIKRVFPDQKMFDKLLAGFEAGERMIREIEKSMEVDND